MSEFLLEFFSEEIPARMQAGAREQLHRLFVKGLEGAQISWASIRCFSTPRRLTLVAEGLPFQQPERWEEVKGPSIDAPAVAIEGFLRRCGVEREACEERALGAKGTFLFVKKKEGGAPTATILTALVEEILQQFAWPKSMRWGTAPFTWVRPLHSILPLFAGEVLPVKPPHPSVFVVNTTCGHRFLAPARFSVENFAMYEEKLEKAYVILDQEKRRHIILEGLEKLAQKNGGIIPEYPNLVEEVTGLVEWPVLLQGKIEKEFMGLPKEVLVTAMRHHQRYFPLVDQGGELVPCFFFASNMVAPDGGKNIVQGNERVLRARLQDAQFHWTQDLETGLEIWNEKLKFQLYHADLGTMWQKVVRLGQLVMQIPGGGKEGQLAAHFAKSDLASGMVGEFPELQGVMGGYYAHNAGLPLPVVHAIRTQYLPQGPEDPCPLEPVGVALALVDKLDALVGFFGAGLFPTGSKDPYALRRAAIGIIRLVEENSLTLDIRALIAKAYALFEGLKLSLDLVQEKLMDFFKDRIKYYLKSKGMRHDHVEAALAGFCVHGNILQSLDLVSTIEKLMKEPRGRDIVQMVKRLGNISKGQGQIQTQADIPTLCVDTSLFQENAESILWKRYDALAQEIAKFQWQARGDYLPLMERLHSLVPLTNTYFDEVHVHTQDPHLSHNRLSMVFTILSSLKEIAELGIVES